jgi:hypothetical protein
MRIIAGEPPEGKFHSLRVDEVDLSAYDQLLEGQTAEMALAPRQSLRGVTTAAAIGRLVHHNVSLELNLPSYRVEQAKKSRATWRPSRRRRPGRRGQEGAERSGSPACAAPVSLRSEGAAHAEGRTSMAMPDPNCP